jgi:DUF971 family protein
MAVTPIEVIQKRDSDELRITWSDGHETVSKLVTVRLACSCATCNEKRRDHDGQLAANFDDLPGSIRNPTISDIRPVGGYAINFTWGDGHQHGLYTFDTLRSICECERCTSAPPPLPPLD